MTTGSSACARALRSRRWVAVKASGEFIRHVIRATLRIVSKQGKTRGGQRWIDEHINDPYVQRAKQAGYRSRAAFKLAELDDRDRLLRPGLTVLDLGAAPGSWSQLVKERLRGTGQIIAVDLLPIEPLPGVSIIQGDFGDASVLAAVRAAASGTTVALVLSDMAPNISGIASVDQARAIHLAELARDCALEMLASEGDLVIKLFQGSGYSEFLQSLRPYFEQVQTRKPAASRDRSSEMFVVARGRNAQPAG